MPVACNCVSLTIDDLFLGTRDFFLELKEWSLIICHGRPRLFERGMQQNCSFKGGGRNEFQKRRKHKAEIIYISKFIDNSTSQIVESVTTVIMKIFLLKRGVEDSNQIENVPNPYEPHMARYIVNCLRKGL